MLEASAGADPGFGVFGSDSRHRAYILRRLNWGTALETGTSNRRLGRYELIAEIAAGGMGAVVLARLAGPHDSQRRFAIKFLHAQFAREAAFTKMLLDEARIAARIHHPNVVGIQEVCQSPEHGYYLVMDYVEGSSLWDIMRRNDVPPSRRWHITNRIIIDALHGLHAAHTLVDEDSSPLKVVHRDVSPQNILVGIDGVSRVTDFGIAKASSRITGAANANGKIAYMAPEQARRKDVDARADIFAMGVVLWECLVGERLFKSGSDADTHARVMSGVIPLVRDRLPEVLPGLETVCARALQRNRERRFATAREMALALEAAAREHGQLADPYEVGAWVREAFAAPSPIQAIATSETSDTGKGLTQRTASDLPGGIRLPSIRHYVDSFASIRRAFFSRYLETQPEEATTLGLHRFDARWRDCSTDALASEAALHRDTLASLDAIPRDALRSSDQLDHDSMRALTRFHVHAYDELKSHLRNIELSLYPYTILQYQIAQALTHDDWSNIARRAAGIGAYLRHQEDNLSRGMALGVAPLDREVVSYFVDNQIPAIMRFFAEQLEAIPAQQRIALDAGEMDALHRGGRSACAAFASHRDFLRDRVLAQSVHGASTLGADEYRWRLENCFAIRVEPGDLIARAEKVLREMQTEVIALAARIARQGDEAGPPVTTFEQANQLFRKLAAIRPEKPEEIIPLYRARLERAVAFIGAQRMFRVPKDFDLGMKPTPPGMSENNNGTNWPAPLLDPTRRGYFVVSSDVAAHPIVQAAFLAVHEGIPGHYLQSLCWQRAFNGQSDPVRFLVVADDVAIARNYFAPMLNIEGFATYAEELMRRRGFFTDHEALFASIVRAFRAVRVVVDISIHTGRMTDAQAARYVSDNACMDLEAARAQVFRYRRIPTQAITYLLGALEIERLADDCRRERGVDFDETNFHDEFFAFGPTPPGNIRAHMLRAPQDGHG